MTDVVTALGHRWEASVATLLERVPGVTIARRCADLAELLSVVEAGVGQVAVIGSDLRGLDLATVRRLRARGVQVVGLFPPDDEPSERRLRQLSISHVLSVETTGPELANVIADLDRVPGDDEAASSEPGFFGDDGADSADSADGADGRGRTERGADGEPATPDVGRAGGSRVRAGMAARPGLASSAPPGWSPAGSAAAADVGPDGSDHDDRSAGSQEPAPARARVIAVWGPTGAPGRTTLATALAAELAGRGADVLLVDADTYGGSIAQTLGLLDEAPGIAAACRAADHGTLDVPSLARLAPTVTPRLRVLTGLPKAERWPEVRAAALERVIELSRELVSVVVVDCGFCLENDEELSYDTAAPRRNEATLTSLAGADIVVAVSGADPIALQRFVRGLQELGSVPSPPPVAVVNRVRGAAVGSKPEARIAESLLRFAGLDSVRFVPDDPATVDAAVLAGRSVVELAPDSAVSRAVADLATALAPWTRSRQVQRRRRWAPGARRTTRPAEA
ncbi:hypothetical protein BA895_09685 [Humibacillus sp. DSM 29435]|uniref:AAA family ATPase n=1 Tax=Humibacillus sp. DSM 29435 TaxID=1869167 RepID=UPI00087293ED|nr:P-loop NTPase [Humibacillus sp. DSM 29435]OFE14616.1 hypothetical protein BA895_09685 [Humibacillus sp. DSM 29435]